MTIVDVALLLILFSTMTGAALFLQSAGGYATGAAIAMQTSLLCSDDEWEGVVERRDYLKAKDKRFTTWGIVCMAIHIVTLVGMAYWG